MPHRATTDRNRAVVAAAVAVCAVAMASAATVLDASLSTPVASGRQRSAPGGISIFTLLLALLRTVLSVFGLSIEMAGGGFGGGTVLRALLGVGAAAFRHRLALVAASTALTFAALAYRRDAGIVAPVSHLRANAPVDATETDQTSIEWPRDYPDDEVSRAWLELVERADVSEPATRTPAEVSRRAVEAGLDPDAVRTLTEAFRAARYGSGSAAESRLASVRRARRAIGEDSEGENR